MILSKVVSALVVLAILALQAHESEGVRYSRSSRSGTSRSGSTSRTYRTYRTTSGSTRRTSSSSTYRGTSRSSSTFRTRSSGAYRGRVATGVSYTTVRTRTTIITTRYRRSYSSARIGSVYWGYYALYYYQASLYSRLAYYPTGTTLCENYEADVNGTSIGWFKCPFPFEPSTYTACCGDQYAEFCCEPDYYSSSSYSYGRTSSGLSVGAIIGIVFVVLFVILLIVGCGWNRHSHYRHSSTVVTTSSTSTTVHHEPSVMHTNSAFVGDPYGPAPQPPPTYGFGGPVGPAPPPPYLQQAAYPAPPPGQYPPPTYPANQPSYLGY